MKDFLTTTVEPMFTSDSAPAPNNWASWSSASDQNMSSRISNSEVIDSSTNSNQPGMRYLALATTVVNSLMGSDVSLEPGRAERGQRPGDQLHASGHRRVQQSVEPARPVAIASARMRTHR